MESAEQKTRMEFVECMGRILNRVVSNSSSPLAQPGHRGLLPPTTDHPSKKKRKDVSAAGEAVPDLERDDSEENKCRQESVEKQEVLGVARQGTGVPLVNHLVALVYHACPWEWRCVTCRSKVDSLSCSLYLVPVVGVIEPCPIPQLLFSAFSQNGSYMILPP